MRFQHSGRSTGVAWKFTNERRMSSLDIQNRQVFQVKFCVRLLLRRNKDWTGLEKTSTAFTGI
jgi:hypothetical protein